MSKNLVLYALTGAERRPVFSCDDGSADARLKFLIKAGDVMREAERAGREHPEFVAVRESREADEGGQVVVSAKFEELDPFTLDVKRTCAKLADCFVKPVALAAVTPEDAAKSAARALSATLSE